MLEAGTIPYLTIGDATLLAELYRPFGPVVGAIVDVHGGAWTALDRFENRPFLAPLVEAGFLVLSIDFRMPPSAGYPETVADINYAIRWLKSRSTELGFDAAKVFGLGSSSGGHLIVLSALRPGDPRYLAHADPATAGFDASLAGVVACWPVLDPVGRYRMAVETGRQRLVQGHDAFWGTSAAMDGGSPIGIVERREPVALPPVLVVQGTADENLDHHSIDRFAAAYRALGGEAEFHKYPGQKHGFMKHEPDAEAGRDAIARMVAFFGRLAR
ncbi:MAG TPA: alpha/beta hydrolase [Devosiaceae bacterium]|jgi:acetyl esterase/lipase